MLIMQDISYCSDKYQYTMGKSFYDSNMKDKIATFNLFFRQAPDNNNWAVVSGIEESLEMITNLGKADTSFFEKFLPGEEYKEFREYLSTMKFTGDVYAMREGEIAFPKQPILTIRGPIIEAQVLETPLLSIMNHQMAIATKASRVTRSTQKPVSEFGSRRAHGPWAAVYGGKAAYIGGCAGTSNILSTAIFGTPCSGTMAHSYVSSFGNTVSGEFKAFDTYIKTHPNESIILLVDTYDTLKCGIINAIRALKYNGIDDNYPQGYGIRLDSGDLTYLSQKCREELDRAGLKNCKIFATNSLDEYIINDIERQNAQIDAYGVGDAIATSKHNPCFGNIYKLVEIDNEPILKRSEDKSKLINPGFQITYRIIQNNSFKGDITALRGDSFCKAIESNSTIHTQAEYDKTKYTIYKKGSYQYKELQHKVIENGKIISQEPEISKRRDYYLDNLAHLNPTEKRIINPHYYKVDISDDLHDTKMNLIHNLIDEINQMDMELNTPTVAVIDMQYDFINGSLACNNSEKAVKNAISFINKHPDYKVWFSKDFHPANHCSFTTNGGIWPTHCQENTKGSELHEDFYTKIENPLNRPNKLNTFIKGNNCEQEEYSAENAKNGNNEILSHLVSREIIVLGIATEYCVKETVIALIKLGCKISIPENSLAYVNYEEHKKTIKELKKMGVEII